MRFLPGAVRGAAAAMAMAAAALAAGCAGGTPATGSASAHRVAAKVGAGTSGAVPPVFAASFAPARAGSAGDRVALLSSRTGARLRWLTPPPERATDEVLDVRDGWVYFVRYPIDLSGALTYVIQRLSPSGAARASLVAWQAGHRTTLLSFPAGMQTPFYDMTAQGQAIWVSGPARPKGPWRIWRWPGGAPGAPGTPGAPVQITALPPLGASPYYGVGAIAW